MAKHTQDTSSSQTAKEAQIEGGAGLDDLIQQGARRIIQQAIEAELAVMLEQYSNVKTIDGRHAVVRNGYPPEREIGSAANILNWCRANAFATPTASTTRTCPARCRRP